MASFLAQRSVPRRSQKVSHGGLGGCVQIKPEEQGHEDTSKLTWPLRRKRRPLAVNTNLIKPERSLSTMTPTSVVLHNVAIYEGLDPPQSDEVKTARLEEDIVELLSPMKRDEMEGGSNVFAERPQTPPTPEQTAPLLVELPGSILLPSQGFPQQNPPVTPARDDWHGFGSDVSRPSSTPSLDTSSTTDSEMEIFKNLTSPNKRSGRANTFPASPAKNGSKPFKAMTAEELMECLPELSMSVVSHHWVPAMENELKKIKILLQEAAEARLQSHIELETLGSDITSIALSARDISRNYFDAMQRVRPLADRDQRAANDQLDFTQTQLQTALAVVEENKNIISDKDNLIERLHETISANTRTFGGFIQDHIGSRLKNLHDIRTQEVTQLIEDQEQISSESGRHSPTRYIRISEKQYNSYLQQLRHMQQKVETYNKVANGQLELIHSQSAELDKRTQDYEKVLTLLSKRHDRIVELESKFEANDEDLKAARETADAYNILKEDHENLSRHCADLEWTVQSGKDEYQKKLEDRNTEIFSLRQQLGNAVLEAASQKAEMMASNAQPEPSTTISRFRNPLHFRKHSASKDGTLPIHARRALFGKLSASQSMLSLNTSHTSTKPETTSIHRTTPSPLSEVSRPSADGSSSDQGSGRLLSGLKLNPPSPPSSNNTSTPLIRPRKDSLQKARTETPTEERPPSSLVDREKALPNPPPSEPEQSSSLHTEAEAEDDHHTPIVPMHQAPITAMMTPRKRVLSGITEASFEGSSSNIHIETPNKQGALPPTEAKSPPSATSSDKNAFRSSMAILNRFDTATFEEEQEEAPDAYRGDLNPWTENGERSDFDLPARASGHGYEGGGRGTELSLPFPPVPGSRYYCPGGGGEEVMSAREVYRGHDFNERSPRRPGGMLVRGGRARRRGWSMGVGSASGSKV